jgi:outer membrane protein, multidrug efflux system
VRLAGHSRSICPGMSASLVLACAVGPSACTVGPNYHLPENAAVRAKAAQGAFVGSKQPSVSVDALPPRWWRLYDNATLDRLVREALESNTDLRMANANLTRSQALLREVKTLRQPSAAFEGGIDYGQLAGEQYLVRARPPLNTYYEVGVTVGYDLDLFGAIRRGIEAASADDAAVEAARDLVMVNVAAETARAYADACGVGLQLNAAKRSAELQQQSLDLTRKLFSGGRAVDLDVTRSRQLVNQLLGVIPSLEAAQRNAVFRLATLTGKLPSQFDAQIDECAQPPRLSRPLPVGDGAALLKRRPDVREAERQLAAATAQIGVVTAQLYPDVQIGLPFGSLGAKPDFLTAPTNYWSMGGVVKWQANQSAARARIARAHASANIALAHFDGVVLGALRDAETTLNNYTHDLERETSITAAREDAARAVDEAHRLQIEGRANSLAVVDAERTLAVAEQALAQTRAAISTDQVNVFLALGGGWEGEAG